MNSAYCVPILHIQWLSLAFAMAAGDTSTLLILDFQVPRDLLHLQTEVHGSDMHFVLKFERLSTQFGVLARL